MAVSFPVWVGGLSVDAKENVLYDLFSKFGPIKNVVILRDDSGKSKQCGFVNFLVKAAAEAAASTMEGSVVMGQTIRTLGPANLLASGKNTTFLNASTGIAVKRDYRLLTDCVFFMDSRECLPKNGEVRPRIFLSLLDHQ